MKLGNLETEKTTIYIKIVQPFLDFGFQSQKQKQRDLFEERERERERGEQ